MDKSDDEDEDEDEEAEPKHARDHLMYQTTFGRDMLYHCPFKVPPPSVQGPSVGD